MKQITLNEEQVEKLLANRELGYFNNESETIEISENNIRLNQKGTIYNLKSVDFVFSKRKLMYEEKINYLRAMLCDYLNLSEEEIVFVSTDNTEYVFSVRFSPMQEVSLLLCDKNSICWNKGDIDDNKFSIFSENQFGYYRRLGNSEYVFRWLTSIV